ncbi:MAG: hypothetical protein ACREFZ_06415 [Acetobacteraceae bacterium]
MRGLKGRRVIVTGGCASATGRAAVLGLLADGSLARQGGLLNAVCPGPTDTPSSKASPPIRASRPT